MASGIVFKQVMIIVYILAGNLVFGFICLIILDLFVKRINGKPPKSLPQEQAKSEQRDEGNQMKNE